jgi:hypothetical protein
MRGALIMVVVGCGRSAPGPAPDAPGNPPSLTVNVHAAVGMVVSDPPGIRCGACQLTQTSGEPCPPGPRTDRTCGVDFAAGTVVALALVGEDMYTGYVCADEPARSVTSCNFAVGAPITIGVWGEVPVR